MIKVSLKPSPKYSTMKSASYEESFEITDKDEKQSSSKCFVATSIFCGQILALFLASSGICAMFLVRSGFNIPLTQNTLHYTTILFIFGSLYLIRYSLYRYQNTTRSTTVVQLDEPIPRGRDWFIVGCCGIVDFFAFWAIVAAYGYTSITSIQLLDCVGIPVSMLLSFILMKHRYSWTHYVGAVLCIVGACVMVGADVLTKNYDQLVESSNEVAENEHTYAVIIGDLLAITGAIMYGLSCVLQEYISSHYGPRTYLTFLGLTAAPLCMIFVAVLEHEQIYELLTRGTLNYVSIPTSTLYYYLGYGGSMFALVVFMAYTIKRLQAVFVNLSLLTADFYSLFAGIWLFNFKFHYLYFISFAVVLIGAITFSIRPVGSKSTNKDI